MAMEFWGVEVKVGQALEVEPGNGHILHLSQGCLGEMKKENANEAAYMYVKTGHQKLCLGKLSGEKFPQIAFDLVFDKRFELSHTSKSANVHFSGYKTLLSDTVRDMYGKQHQSDVKADNGVQFHSGVDSESEDTSDRSDDSDSDDSSSDDGLENDTNKDMLTVAAKEDSSDDEDSDEDESDTSDSESDQETQNKVTSSKKRESDSAPTVPVSVKKAKFFTPEQTDSKKSGGRVATPYPLKQSAKSTSDKPAQSSHKIVEFRCNPCNRTFGSDMALQSHTKAKHAPK